MKTRLVNVAFFIAGALFMAAALQTGSHVHADDGEEMVPVVPALIPTFMRMHDTVQYDGPMRLDGLKCDACVLAAPSIVYGGGAFDVRNSVFVGIKRIDFTGAAANTLAFLHFLDAVHSNQEPPKPKNNLPISNTDLPDKRFTIDLASPYGRKQ
jgi:hypothetical protein